MCRNDIFIAQKIIQLVINNPFQNFTYDGNDWNRSIIRSDVSPCLNNGVTLAHFQSSGNIPECKDLLQRSHRETETRSAHSRIILAEILSRPFALDLHNLFGCEKTILLLVDEKLNLLWVIVILFI